MRDNRHVERSKRIFDIALALLLLIFLSPVLLLIALLVRLTSKGPALYWSARVGRGNELFKMPKFRTMRVDTPQVATHLLTDADAFPLARRQVPPPHQPG